MKRLNYYLLQMQNSTRTYKDMYEGPVNVVPQNGESYSDSDETYWYRDISISVTATNKLSLDKPTLKICIPADDIGIREYTVAVADFCLREFKKRLDALNAELDNRSRPDNENGKYYIHSPGGEILARNTSFFSICPQKYYRNGQGQTIFLLPDHEQPRPQMCICILIQVQLPQNKVRKARQMLCQDLPSAIDNFISEFDLVKLNSILDLAHKQKLIRSWLKSSKYCAFIADGSILPRKKGTDLPLENAVPFKSPPENRIVVCGIPGMGIPKGVTVITGGGFSGKSTLLEAISSGVYDHCLGDGRELCVSDSSAVSISAEDGRSCRCVNISPFLKWLPDGNVFDFSTDQASGSTSQATNIMEAIDSDSTLLLIDEDRSATNFMIRDAVMKRLVEEEPIIPFTDRVKELNNLLGVSTILVIGGSGEYLSVADNIYMMVNFQIKDVTLKAIEAVTVKGEAGSSLSYTEWKQSRLLCTENFSSYPAGSGRERLEISDDGFIVIGDERIDVRGLKNIVSRKQIDTIGLMIRYLENSNTEPRIDIKTTVDKLYTAIEKEGIDFLYSTFFTNISRFLDLPRRQELIAVINRMQKVKFMRGDTRQ